MLQNESLDKFLDCYLGDCDAKKSEFMEKFRDMDEIDDSDEIHNIVQLKHDTKLPRRTWLTFLLIAILTPITILAGIYLFHDRSYYFISLMIILYSLIPFLAVFEGRKPQARELVIISVLAAITVAGRAAFFMIPQFKPMAALIIISGVCFGGEAGFLVGAISALISNFFFGQGPWTPWQMFAFGMIGFLAGILYKKGILTSRKLSLCIFGFFSVLCIYGFLMNTSSVFMYTQGLKWQSVLSIYMMGIPMDLIHAASTVVFLWLISGPMIEKLERVKIKYGLIER